MKRINWALALVLPLLWACGNQTHQALQAAQESANEQKHEINHFVEEVATPSAALEAALALKPTQTFSRFSETVGDEFDLASLGELINLGAQIWQIIVDNRPVTNVSSIYANALPRGVKDAADLEFFSPVQFKSYRMYGENLYGIEVYNIVYTVVHRYGGKYQGHGQFLENVSILPTKVEAAWGYTVNMSVDATAPVNLGSTKDPIASLILATNIKVSTILMSSESRHAFQFRGDSAKSVLLEE